MDLPASWIHNGVQYSILSTVLPVARRALGQRVYEYECKTVDHHKMMLTVYITMVVIKN
jgi:hypothetical protein